MKGMMWDKDPERGINRGKSRKEISSKRKIKKWKRENRGGEKKRHININNLSHGERESERERGEKGGGLNREMNIKQTEMEGGE